jgi:hypothetical protein
MENNIPTFELHKLPEGFIVTSDEEIKENDYVIEDIGGTIYGPIDRESIVENPKKVIVQQDQIDFSALLEEEQKKIGWFDYAIDFANEIKHDGLDYNTGRWYGRIEGFQKAQELLSDRRFTIKDMFFVFNKGIEFGDDEIVNFRKKFFDKSIQSLSQKSWKVELEMEFCPQALPKDRYTPKLTNGKIKIIKLL